MNMPLPATREEARAIGDVVLVGADASEPKLIEAMRARPRWAAVHLACHGIPDARYPEECALALTSSATEDGRFTSLDVLAIDVSADLVVLSACESGVGRAQRGEGTMSLARAFLAAGAPRVVSSLWKVDDDATTSTSAARIRASTQLRVSIVRQDAPRLVRAPRRRPGSDR